MTNWWRSLAFSALAAAGLASSAIAQTPKQGGTLNFMIAADGGPSLDGHRETTYAVLHATAPFYSTLIRVKPDDPANTTEFACDLCTEFPTPTDNGLTWTFKIRKGVKHHSGNPVTAKDAEWSLHRLVLLNLNSANIITKWGINKDNVKDLRIAWRWKADNFGPRPDYNFQATPIMVKGVLYTTAGTRRAAVAIDAATGKTIWTYSHRPAEGTRNPCCGNLTRGVAILGDKLFLAGLETVKSLLSFFVGYLATHPEQYQRLIDNPALIPAAMEELRQLCSFVKVLGTFPVDPH